MVACAVKVPGAAENMTLMSGDDGGRTNGELHTPLHSKLKFLQPLGPESTPKKKGMVTEFMNLDLPTCFLCMLYHHKCTGVTLHH